MGVCRRVVGVASVLLLGACASSSTGGGTIVSTPDGSGSGVTVPGTTINVPLSTVAVPTTTTPGSTTTTIASVQGLGLSHTGLGGALFGADPEPVVRYMSAILGAPTSDTGWVDTTSLAPLRCRGTQARFVAFHDLQLFFSDESGYAKGRLHFAAFTYGPAQGDHIDPYGLATDTGMKVGATVAEMKKAYPKLGLNQPSQAHPYPGFSIRHGLIGILTGLLDTDTVTAFIGGSACTK
jgi:hypothetical protein